MDENSFRIPKPLKFKVGDLVKRIGTDEPVMKVIKHDTNHLEVSMDKRKANPKKIDEVKVPVVFVQHALKNGELKNERIAESELELASK